MTYRELMKALLAGKKLRLKEWPKDMYIFMNENDEIEDNEGFQIKKGQYSAILREGLWNLNSNSGVFNAYLGDGSSFSNYYIGFRYFDEWEIIKPKKKIKLLKAARRGYVKVEDIRRIIWDEFDNLEEHILGKLEINILDKIEKLGEGE